MSGTDDGVPSRDDGLSAERTTLAWRRTGMSTVVLGGLTAEGLSDEAPLFAFGLGLILAFIGMAVMVVGRHGPTPGPGTQSRHLVPLLGRTVAVVAWAVAVVTVSPLP